VLESLKKMSLFQFRVLDAINIFEQNPVSGSRFLLIFTV